MLEETSKNYSINCHSSVNHFYDDLPYSYHLEMVNKIAKKFIHLIPEKDRDLVLASTWAHDLIEDCRVTYNNVKEILTEDVADIVYALTNEKGKTRKERANEKYYLGIKETKYATFVKLCDRIANVQFSKQNGSSMFNSYKKEFEEFENFLYEEQYSEIFEFLKSLINEEINITKDSSIHL